MRPFQLADVDVGLLLYVIGIVGAVGNPLFNIDMRLQHAGQRVPPRVNGNKLFRSDRLRRAAGEPNVTQTSGRIS